HTFPLPYTTLFRSILKGIHRVAEAGSTAEEGSAAEAGSSSAAGVSAEEGSGERPQAQLLASGVAVPWALEARGLLAADWGVDADVGSVTSRAEARRGGV